MLDEVVEVIGRDGEDSNATMNLSRSLLLLGTPNCFLNISIRLTQKNKILYFSFDVRNRVSDG